MADDRTEIDIAQLVAEHHRGVYSYAFRLTGSVPDAEDLTQHVFLVAQQKLGQLENVERARGWLFAILRNAFLKSHRKRRPIPAGNLDLNIEAIPDNLPADGPIDRERLQLALDDLQPKHRVILVMFYYESCSYREIADRLDIPMGTVMSRLAGEKAIFDRGFSRRGTRSPFPITRVPPALKDDAMQHDKDRELRLIKAVEACRPRSDDLADPDFAFLREKLANDAEIQALYQRVQEMDGTIADAFQAVPVPEGLEDRIVERLAAARSGHRAGAEEDSQTQAASLASSIRMRKSRRWIFGGAGALAAAAAVLVAVLFLARGRQPVAGADVPQAAIGLFEQDFTEFGTGKRIDEAPPDFPPSRDVRLPPARWRWVPDFLGHRAVAYDAPLPGGSRATLYVLRAAATGLPSVPPQVPYRSGGPSVAAWTAGGLVYVLTFDGGRRMYQRLLQPQGPIT